jgi:hypothetical protein
MNWDFVLDGIVTPPIPGVPLTVLPIPNKMDHDSANCQHESSSPVRVPAEHHESKKERWISPPLPGRFMVPKGGLDRFSLGGPRHRPLRRGFVLTRS